MSYSRCVVIKTFVKQKLAHVVIFLLQRRSIIPGNFISDLGFAHQNGEYHADMITRTNPIFQHQNGEKHLHQHPRHFQPLCLREEGTARRKYTVCYEAFGITFDCKESHAESHPSSWGDYDRVASLLSKWSSKSSVTVVKTINKTRNKSLRRDNLLISRSRSPCRGQARLCIEPHEMSTTDELFETLPEGWPSMGFFKLIVHWPWHLLNPHTADSGLHSFCFLSFKFSWIVQKSSFPWCGQGGRNHNILARNDPHSSLTITELFVADDSATTNDIRHFSFIGFCVDIFANKCGKKHELFRFVLEHKLSRTVSLQDGVKLKQKQSRWRLKEGKRAVKVPFTAFSGKFCGR